jgi:M6 family metalloprotease-like protein
MKRWSAVVPVLLACALRLWSLEPPAKGELSRYAADGTLADRLLFARALGNDVVAPELIQSLRTRMERLGLRPPRPASGARALGLPPATTNTLKSKGRVKILALCLAFPDYPALTSAAAITSKLFGDGDGGFPYESLRNYYRRASYGALEIEGTVLGWYQVPYARDSMAMTTAARETLIKQALTYYDGLGHDFSQYDNDGNGKIDYFVVIWSGPNNGWSNFWWGYQTSMGSAAFTLDGKSFAGSRYSWQWELRNYPSGTYDQVVVMHETGHAFGLPDYYDYDATVGPKGGLGGLDMMDANRYDHNGFSKMLLDWLTPRAFNYGIQTASLAATGNTAEAMILMPEYSASQPFIEFYMIQNRYRVENDAGLPADGLIIWHVDATLTSSGGFLYNNSTSAHKLLRLMEADGLEHIEQGYAATAADFYVKGKTFGPSTRPGSSRYDATDSGLSVFNIGTAGQTAAYTADIHYSLYPPDSARIERLTEDYIFFTVARNRVRWSASPRNHTAIAKYLLYAKAASAADAAYVLLAEVPASAGAGGAFLYEHKNLDPGARMSYRIIAVDIFGATGDPAEVKDVP